MHFSPSWTRAEAKREERERRLHTRQRLRTHERERERGRIAPTHTDTCTLSMEKGMKNSTAEGEMEVTRAGKRKRREREKLVALFFVYCTKFTPRLLTLFSICALSKLERGLQKCCCCCCSYYNPLSFTCRCLQRPPTEPAAFFIKFLSSSPRGGGRGIVRTQHKMCTRAHWFRS